MIDIGTRYGERAIKESRSAEEVKRKFETCWSYNYGPPIASVRITRYADQYYNDSSVLT